MVASVDGRAASGGKASGLGSAADRVVMDNLRAGADAVMIGAGTLRAEKLTLNVSAEAQHLRRARGLPPQPLAVLVAGMSDPTAVMKRNLLGASTEGTVLVVPEGQRTAGPTLRWADGGAQVIGSPAREDGPGGVDLRELLRRLREGYGVRRLLVEGGPSINGALFAAGLVSELFVTISPRIVGDGGAGQGGPPPPVVSGLGFSDEGRGPLHLDLRSAHARGSELFLRYGVRSGA